MGFFSYGHIPVSFVFRGQYDAVWGLLPVEKSRQRRTQAAELGCPGNIHGCCQSACPAILPAENQGKRNARTPARPVSCSDHDEAGGGSLPGLPGRFFCRTVQTAVWIPWLLQLFAYSCRVGLADTARWCGRMENGAERLSKPFTGCLSFRAAVSSAVIQFSGVCPKSIECRIVIFTNLFKNRLEIRMKSAFQSLIV